MPTAPTESVTERTRVRRAFKVLSARGVFARQNFECCGSCGFARAASEAAPGAPIVFYHGQDHERTFTGPEHRRSPLFVAYGVNRDSATDAEIEAIGRLAREAFEAEGCTVVWDGTAARRLEVRFPDREYRDD